MSSTHRSLPPLQTRPLAEQAREALLTAIREGRFPEGRLPPEADLAGQLGVSRGTLRAALQSLSAEGLISRRRRHGTFVNEHLVRASMPLNRMIPFARLVEQSGYVASTDPSEYASGPAEDSEAEELALSPGTEVLRAFRLLRADGEPVITVTDVLELTRLSVDPAKLKPAETTFEFLERNAGTRIDYATSEIVPRVATASTPRRLGLRAGTPYVQLHEVVYNESQERVALSVICVVDRLVRLSLLRRGR
jgi:GntR family transcriptional regulator